MLLTKQWNYEEEGSKNPYAVNKFEKGISVTADEYSLLSSWLNYLPENRSASSFKGATV